MTTRIVTVAAILAAATSESSMQDIYRNWYPFYGQNVGQQQVIARKFLELKGINDILSGSPEPVPYSPRIATPPPNTQYQLYNPSIYRKCQGPNCDQSTLNPYMGEATQIPTWLKYLIVKLEDVQQQLDAIFKKLSTNEQTSVVTKEDSGTDSSRSSDSYERLTSITSPVAVAIKDHVDDPNKRVATKSNPNRSSGNQKLQENDRDGDEEDLEMCDEDDNEDSSEPDNNPSESINNQQKTIEFSLPSGQKHNHIPQKASHIKKKSNVEQGRKDFKHREFGHKLTEAKPTTRRKLRTLPKSKAKTRLETRKYLSQRKGSKNNRKTNFAKVIQDEITTPKAEKEEVLKEFGIYAEELPRNIT